MRIEFFGVRGSIATPGATTVRTGGNTSCIEVVCGEERIILDAGTGLRALGQRMAQEHVRGKEERASLLLSHYHWDHIQGLPFFLPMYSPEFSVRIAGMRGVRSSLGNVLETQMSAPGFPVEFAELRANVSLAESRPGDSFHIGGVLVRTAKLNHPGGSMAYRLDYEGRSIVFATDTEHPACVDPALQKLSEGADVLVYDAQYTTEEYRSKVGWGHSTYEAACELALGAGVEKLVLYHHDPNRTDEQVDDIEAKASRIFRRTQAAREGLLISLSAQTKAA